jgi:hypothetical protein
MNAKDYDKLTESEKKKEDWMNSKWRPMMGWTYMLTCITDFVIFPILWSAVQALGQGQVNMQWQPITLQGAGLFHIAMGAILGIAAYGRTQEKMNGANNGGLQLPANVGTTYVPPAPVGQPAAGGFGAPVSTQVMHTYGSQPMGSGFSSGSSFTSAGSFGAAPMTTSFKGKPGPVQPDYPEI